ncbi:MAG: hypothetical protein HFJ12_06150 [Bacilli bacterium]|nr:hypothetical protein [Bacilli bacterium]
MRDYDFHELLSDSEFESFAASVLQIRDRQQVKMNQRIKDGGIDLYYLEENVIGQVKRYKNKNSNIVFSLKKEIERVKRENPDRYVIVTSTVISKEKREILLSLFEGYLHKEDIIDKNDLNQLLVDPEYHKLEIEYLKLLVPNSFVLSHYLDKIRNNAIYTKTSLELDKIKEEQKIFSVNEVFVEALDRLLKEKTIIITGEPGIGKSILGRMLSSYLITSNPDCEFISVESLDELYQIFKEEKKQIYFFDDFWGDTEYNFRMTENEKEKIINFSKYIQKFEDKWFIITTREYILKDGVQLNARLRDKYQLYQYSINLEEISKTSKFNILFNHINHAKLSWNHSNILLHHWKTIVDNNNYNPRYVQTFLNSYDSYKHLNNYDFVYQMIDYLNHPFEFWEDTLNKQPLEIILLLMIIALNDNGLDTRILHKKYNDIVNIKKIEKNDLNDFKSLLKRMDNEFTITKEGEESSLDVVIKFRNPSYKDFIYEYLKNNMAFYIPYIYNENLSMNECVHLWGIINKDFVLFKDLYEVEKLELRITNQMIDQVVNTDYSCFVELAAVTEFGFSSKIQNYLIQFMEESFNDIENIYYFDSKRFQLVFELLHQLVNKYDFSEYIASLLEFIIFEDQQLFYIEKILEIKNLYPDVFESFYKEYKNELRKFLLYGIKSEVYDYEYDNDLPGLKMLRYDDIPILYDSFHFKVPKKLIEEVDKVIDKLQNGDIYPQENGIPKLNHKRKKDKEEDLSLVDDKIKEFIGDNEYIESTNKLLKEWEVASDVKKKISRLEKNELVGSLVHYKKPLYLLCQYFSEHCYLEDEMKFLINFVDYLIMENDFTWEETEELYELAQLLIIKKRLVFRKEELLSLNTLYPKCIDRVINSSFFLKRGEWYHFIHPIIQIYLVLILIKYSSTDEKNAESEKNIDLEVIIYHFDECNSGWRDLNFDDYEEITSYRLVEKAFVNRWQQEIRIPMYKQYLKKINTKNNQEIAKSMLRPFDLSYEYEYIYGYQPRTGYQYREALLYRLLKMDFGVDIIKLFILNMTPSDKMNQFLYELAEKEEILNMNQFLRRKVFIELLKEGGIFDILSNLYQNILLEVTKK